MGEGIPSWQYPNVQTLVSPDGQLIIDETGNIYGTCDGNFIYRISNFKYGLISPIYNIIWALTYTNNQNQTLVQYNVSSTNLKFVRSILLPNGLNIHDMTIDQNNIYLTGLLRSNVIMKYSMDGTIIWMVNLSTVHIGTRQILPWLIKFLIS